MQKEWTHSKSGERHFLRVNRECFQIANRAIEEIENPNLPLASASLLKAPCTSAIVATAVHANLSFDSNDHFVEMPLIGETSPGPLPDGTA